MRRSVFSFVLVLLSVTGVTFSQDSLYYYDAAKNALADYNLKNASVYCDSLISNSRNPGKEVWLLRTNIYERKAEYEVCISSLEKVKSPSYGLQIRLAEFHMKLSDYKSAIAIFDTLVYQYPSRLFALERKGDCYLKLNDYDNAAKSYNNLLVADSNYYNAYKKLAAITNKIGMADYAIEYAEKALKLKNELVLHKILTENSFKKKEYFSTVKSGLQTLVQGDTTASVVQKVGISYYYIAKDAISQGAKIKTEEAIKFLHLAAELNENDVISPFYLALAYKSADSLDKAEEWFKITESKIFPDYLSEFYFQFADVYQRKENYPEAIKYFRKSLKEDNTKIANYFYLASLMDTYYEDKEIALLYYKTYLNKMEDPDPNILNYIKKREDALREVLHFNGKSKSIN